MLSNSWHDWQPVARPLRRKPEPAPRAPALEVEPLTVAEAEALRLAVLAGSTARCAALRRSLIASGHIVPKSARVEEETTAFRNDAKLPVFAQGRLTAKQLAASHPAELQEVERQERPRERSAAGRRGKK